MSKRSALFGALLAGAVLCGQATASEMQLDAGIGLSDDFNAYQVTFTYFLQPLQDSEHPYDLQAFMQKAAFLQADYLLLDSDSGSISWFDLNGEFFMPDPVPGLSLRPRLVNLNAFGTSATGWALDVGYYALDNLKITLPAVAGGSFESGQDVLEFNFDVVQAEYVHPLGSQSLYLLGAINFDADLFTVGATYYLDKSLGLGGEIRTGDGDTDITMFASYWLSPTFAVRAGLMFGDVDTTIMVGASARF